MGNLLEEERAGALTIGSIMAVSSAVPDSNKNNTVQSGIAPLEEKRRNELTDSNRSAASGTFLDSDCDWIFWIDDDTVPPSGAITQLLSLRREFVGGVYYNAKPPYNPIAYLRGDNGLYDAVYDFPFGAVMQVDSIGMGCTLIHRSVYERIMDAYRLFHRPNGTLLPVLKEHIYSGGDNRLPAEISRGSTVVYNGYMVQRLSPIEPPDNRAWPFYALEYGRTEDHWFCELAAAIGIKPWLDTSINCEHWKQQPTTRKHYNQERRKDNERITAR